MPKVACDITMSVDGFVAGPNQSLSKPFGDGVGKGERLHAWMFDDRDANAEEVAAITDAGAFIMGRNMFGPPGGGGWDSGWKGWWGETPPFHAPVFVLTHHPRAPLRMLGGTTVTFVSDGIYSALAQAAQAAGDRNVTIAGGAEVVNQFLAARLIDELRLHVVPLLLGAGARLFEGVGDVTLEPLRTRATKLVTHLSYRLAH